MKSRPALPRPIGALRVERLIVPILRPRRKRKEGSQGGVPPFSVGHRRSWAAVPLVFTSPYLSWTAGALPRPASPEWANGFRPGEGARQAV